MARGTLRQRRRRLLSTTGYRKGSPKGSGVRRVPRPPRGPQGPVDRTGPTATRTPRPVLPRAVPQTPKPRISPGDHHDALTEILGVVDSAANILGSAVQTATRGAKEAEKAVGEVARLPSKRVDHVLATKTLGSPTVKELANAFLRGQLKTNQAGKLTTPAARTASRQLKALRTRRSQLKAPLPGLDRNQERVARTVLKVGDRKGATGREKLAAIETGLVESGLRNLPGGDRDSQGFRQERTSIYGTGPKGPRNVRASAGRLFNELRTDPGTEGAPTPGLLAQAAQGSAFPERYDQEGPFAKAILRTYEKGKTPPPRLANKLQAAASRARGLGIETRPQTLTERLGPPTQKTVTRYREALAVMHRLAKAKIPYVWGGGHGVPGGLDCSGAVSVVLNKVKALKGSLVSGDMGKALEPGPGALTVFYNAGHTFIGVPTRKGWRYWGTSVGDSGKGGLGFHPAPDKGYLSQYQVGHVPGMGRKQALQLGLPPEALSGAGGASFPGIELSSDGSSATIQPGAGVNQQALGLSVSPISLDIPGVASAPLPDAFKQFQGGGEPPAGESGLGEIGQLLRRRR